jgi:DNA repair protein RadC
MPITDWPQEDRPREKLLLKGEKILTDAELIAIFLNTGTRGKTALDIAKELLIEYGDLKTLLLAPATFIMNKRGIGQAKYAFLRAAIELGRRYLEKPISIGETLNNTQVTQAFIANRLRYYRNEVFACVFMDTHFRLLCFEELFHGTVNEAIIYPREIVRRSLYHNAAKIILAHNHPSGHPLPSNADKEITLRIKKALELVDIEVIDHIIVGNPDNFSFAEKGLIDEIASEDFVY